MASSIARPTANRAVHLKFTPRPSSLGESREILRLISQFGEIEYYKNLKYDAVPVPNTAIVIFKEEDAAKHCLHKSPIRFRMGRAPVAEPSNPSDLPAPQLTHENASNRPSPMASSTTHIAPETAFGLRHSRSMSTNSLPTPPDRPFKMPFQPPAPPLLESRIFQIQANPARVHFRDQINRGQYHGSFAIDTKSIPQQDLAKRVPSIGLSCTNWRAEEKPWRLMRQQKEEEHTGSQRRKSLRELYEEGRGGGGAS